MRVSVVIGVSSKYNTINWVHRCLTYDHSRPHAHGGGLYGVDVRLVVEQIEFLCWRRTPALAGSPPSLFQVVAVALSCVAMTRLDQSSDAASFIRAMPAQAAPGCVPATAHPRNSAPSSPGSAACHHYDNLFRGGSCMISPNVINSRTVS